MSIRLSVLMLASLPLVAQGQTSLPADVQTERADSRRRRRRGS
jgi:hypothetical protein